MSHRVARLEVLRAERRIRSVPIGRTPFRIGSDRAADLPVPEPGVAPHHAQIIRFAGAYRVVPELSGASLFLDDIPAPPEGLPLRHGAIIGLGRSCPLSLRFLLEGERQVEGDRLTVRSLRGAGGGGSIEVTGYATLFGNPKFDLRANLNQARIEFPIEITSSLSGNLHLVGTSEGGQLTGEMSVRQMFVSEDFNLLAWMGEFGSRATAPPAPITSGR